MRRLIFLTILIWLLLACGCTMDRLHVERDGTTVDANINYLLQDKNFKFLEYNVDTGTVRVENFGSETSEVLSELIGLLNAMNKTTQ